MNFEDLEAFVRVATQGGFSHASAHHRVAQSALSRRVSRLEHQLGVTLLTRHGRGVRLTEHGIALMERANGLMAEIEAIERDIIQQADEPIGDVSIALPPTTATVLAPLVMTQLRQRAPRVKLHIREGSSGAIHDWMVKGEADIGILYNPEESPSLHVTPFLSEPIHLVASSANPPRPEALAAGTTPDGRFRVKQIGTLPLIMPGSSHSLRKIMERTASDHHVSLDIVNEVDGPRALKAVVEAGLGYTVFSYAGVYEEVSAGTLRLIPFIPALSWTLSLAERRDAPPTRALIELRKAVLDQIAAVRERGYWHGTLLI
nr:LysR family transcriptional regulator [uncultured bacterium]